MARRNQGAFSGLTCKVSAGESTVVNLPWFLLSLCHQVCTLYDIYIFFLYVSFSHLKDRNNYSSLPKYGLGYRFLKLPWLCWCSQEEIHTVFGLSCTTSVFQVFSNWWRQGSQHVPQGLSPNLFFTPKGIASCSTQERAVCSLACQALTKPHFWSSVAEMATSQVFLQISQHKVSGSEWAHEGKSRCRGFHLHFAFCIHEGVWPWDTEEEAELVQLFVDLDIIWGNSLPKFTCLLDQQDWRLPLPFLSSAWVKATCCLLSFCIIFMDFIVFKGITQLPSMNKVRALHIPPLEINLS